MTTGEPRCWQFSMPFTPPGNNHMYAPIGEQGKKALTREARALRASITALAQQTGFEPRLKGTYVVSVLFVFPEWSQDIDGPIKSLLDSVFVAPGHNRAWDHRIVQLAVEKRVQRGERRTDVIIREVDHDRHGAGPRATRHD